MRDYSYVFVGRVLPERAWVTINNDKPVEITLRQQDWDLDCKVMISIDVAQVSCTVTSQTEIKDLETLKNVVSDLVSLEVDAFGYLEGRYSKTGESGLSSLDLSSSRCY